MSSKRALSLELRNAIVWLEKQPEVTGVVQGKYVVSRHKHAPGFARVIETTPKSVTVRAFDKGGSKELYVYAPPTPLRDRWVAALVGGHVIDKAEPKIVSRILPVAPDGSLTPSISVPTPKALNDHAGQIFNVTPALAMKWLERNTRNRDLREDVVQRYAADMKAGRWMVTGDAIAFDTDGAVVNGQHRLWGVVESGVTVPMLVTFNLKPEVVRVLDDHLKRKLTDIIKIDRPGVVINNRMTGASRAMQIASIQLLAGDKRAAVARLSRQQQMEFLEKHYDAVSFGVRECFKKHSMPRGVVNASVYAVLGRAFYSQDHDRLKKFADILTTGIPEDPRADIGALLLRNWLINLTAQGMRAQPEVIYRKTERALMNFCKKEHMKKLYEAADELFLLPEDKAPKKKAS